MQDYDCQGAASDSLGTVFGQNISRSSDDDPADPRGTLASHPRHPLRRRGK